jgi:hypothetical protein
MEHREPPPMVAGDSRTRSVASTASDRLALPPPARPHPNRLEMVRRRAILWLAIVLGVVLCSYLVYVAARAARSWLGDQPEYQLAFREILLEPPPPSWYRGGPSGFLEDVRRRARMPETISPLKLKEADLKQAFKQSPWTQKVESVSYPPLGVTVRLAYLRPVALVETSGGHAYLVDSSAVILPQEDVDTEISRLVKEHKLIEINGVGLSDPQDPKAGLAWRPRPGAADVAPGNERIPAAAKLAGFLLERIRSVDLARQRALAIRYINPMDREGRGLFLVNDDGTSILWGAAPGEEVPGSLGAEVKWGILRDWSEQGKAKPIPNDDYWEITPAGVVHQTFPGNRASESAAIRPVRRDQATIPARASGQ